MRDLPAALGAMGEFPQFIVYVSQPRTKRPGKIDKFPCDYRTGAVGTAHDPALWTDARAAILSAARLGPSYGVGFVFTENDPFFFIDLDYCLLPDGSGWSQTALDICAMFAGAAIEVSMSGKGLHIFGKGKPPLHKIQRDELGIGFYDSKRFVALTGTNIVGDAGVDFSHVLPTFVEQYMPPDAASMLELGWSQGPRDDWRGPADDDELIRRALRSQSSGAVFGSKASFADLWHANTPVLSRAYPDEGRPYNASNADAALAQHLAFWTGNDCERMHRIMLKSALARDKWEREDYLPRTILSAVGRQFEVLQDKALEKLPDLHLEVTTPIGQMVTGSTFAGIPEQLQLFAGCVYVQDQHRVMVPGGYLLKPEQFKVAYGGYTFAMDTSNEKVTRDAWEAFTQNQGYRSPRVNGTCFKPDMPPGCIVERVGQTFVNVYAPADVPRKKGDPTPFLVHLGKVLPNERDQTILLSYMAACVQHKGVKFQWAPLLQGVEGNGKTLFTRCVAEAVGRRYVHWPKASKLCKEFNGWMPGKVFYGVEDIYVPDHKREIIEELKPMITGGDGLEIERKGVDQVSDDICGNFMFNSNHKGAVRKTRNDRRFCVFYTAQQQYADLVRDNMVGDYFTKLYDWLKGDGYAIVTDLLYTYKIPHELNPATGCQRAPVTSTTEEAIAEGVGSIEQEIVEAIEQGMPGFCGGFVSSIMFEKLLERVGVARRITHNRRKDILAELGFVLHPALPEGRTNNPVLPDNGKPRLFVKQDSIAYQIETPALVAKAYETANNHVNVPFPAHSSTRSWG